MSSQTQISELKVFVVGPARSGTSTLFHSFRNILQLPGDGESHLMPLIQNAIFHMRTYYEKFSKHDAELTIKEFSLDDLENIILGYVRAFYCHRFRAQCWVDKTPSSQAAHGVRLILRLFPTAKVLATTRSGLEVVGSRRKKFNESFSTSCAEWAATMEGVAHALDADIGIFHLEHARLSSSPVIVAKEMCEWMGISSYSDAFAQFFTNTRIEASVEPNRAATLAEMDWSEEEKEIFLSICSGMMKRFGYSY